LDLDFFEQPGRTTFFNTGLAKQMSEALPTGRGYMRTANSMWRVPSRVLAFVWSHYLRCPRCGTPQRVTKAYIRPGMRILCWRCTRVFSP